MLQKAAEDMQELSQTKIPFNNDGAVTKSDFV